VLVPTSPASAQDAEAAACFASPNAPRPTAFTTTAGPIGAQPPVIRFVRAGTSPNNRA
jgi:hypothetical protein